MSPVSGSVKGGVLKPGKEASVRPNPGTILLPSRPHGLAGLLVHVGSQDILEVLNDCAQQRSLRGKIWEQERSPAGRYLVQEDSIFRSDLCERGRGGGVHTRQRAGNPPFLMLPSWPHKTRDFF